MKIIAYVFSTLLFLSIQFAHADRLNINTADTASIATTMAGVGEKKAQAIVDYRTRNGNFKSVDELIHVKGIGSKTLENNRGKLTVNSPEDPAQIKAISNETK